MRHYRRQHRHSGARLHGTDCEFPQGACQQNGGIREHRCCAVRRAGSPHTHCPPSGSPGPSCSPTPQPGPSTPQPGCSGRSTRPAGEGPLLRAQRGPLPPAVPPPAGPSPAGPEPPRLKEAAPGTYVVGAAVGAEVAHGTERVARDGSRHDGDHCRRRRSHKATRAQRPPASGGARGLLGGVVRPRAGWPGNRGVLRDHPMRPHQRQAVSVSTAHTYEDGDSTISRCLGRPCRDGLLPEV